MRDRLIELIQKAEKQQYLNAVCGDIDSLIASPRGAEFIADYLLANGAVAPALMIDDTIYRCGADKVYEWQIAYIQVYGDEIVYVDDSGNYIFELDIGKTIFLTREEAEAKLKEGKG